MLWEYTQIKELFLLIEIAWQWHRWIFIWWNSEFIFLNVFILNKVWLVKQIESNWSVICLIFTEVLGEGWSHAFIESEWELEFLRLAQIYFTDIRSYWVDGFNNFSNGQYFEPCNWSNRRGPGKIRLGNFLSKSLLMEVMLNWKYLIWYKCNLN